MKAPRGGLLVTVLGCFVFLSTAIAGGAGFSIPQVMSAPFASALLSSPNGEKVAWILNEQGHRNIWVAGAPDWKGRQVTAFTADDGQDVGELAWAPDSSYLLFTHGGDFENGGENPNPDMSPKKPEQAIWRVSLDGSAAKQLASGKDASISPKGDRVAFLRDNQIFLMRPDGTEPAQAVQSKGSPEGLLWSPNGAYIAFTSNRNEHSFIGVYGVADKNVSFLDASVDEDGAPVWSPDSGQIAHIRIPATSTRAFFAARRTGQPWSIRVVDVRTGAAREVFCADPGVGSVFHEIDALNQIFWAAGDRLLFPWEKTGWLHLYSVPVQGGHPAELTPGDGEVEHVALSKDGKNVYFSANFEDIDRRHIWSVPAAEAGTMKAVTRGEAIEWQPAPLAGNSVAFLGSSYNQKSHAIVLPPGGEQKALAVEAPADFPAKALVKPQPVMITAADGLPIHGQLFLPPDEASARKHPALIFFHGGSRRQMLLGFHYMYYYSNAYAMNQYLASQGYVVLSVNYRSGIGYGLNFREAVNYGASGASEYNDVVGAGLFLKSRADVDPKRIGAWGGSYGGYLTALALARSSDLFAAGVDFHGVHDWSSLRGYLSRPGGSGDPEEVTRRQEAARLAFESSPMAAVDTWRSPVLLIHGDDDRNVDFAQTVMLVEALRKRQVSFEELIFPNEIHDFLLHRHWVQAYEATAAFFADKLGTGH